MQDVTYIDTDQALASACEELAGADRIALDTEFIRERTYFPGICLIQMTAGDGIVLVDPLKVARLEPLYALLADASITKVLHAARQDFEIFYHLTGRVPAPLFDTQIAAALAGFPDQVGYASLVEAILGVELDKSHTRTNWQRRPLSEAQLAYAADDVRYLGPVCDRLTEMLTASGRLAWAREDSAALEDTGLYVLHPENAWRRVKAARHLTGVQRANAVALAAWREQRAIDRDKPRQWMMRDDVLVAIARANPADRKALAEIQGVGGKLVDRHGRAILRALADSGTTSTTGERPRSGRPDAAEAALYKALTKTVDERAAELDVPSAILVSRRDLKQAAAGHSDLAVYSGWRAEAVGRELADMVRSALDRD